MGKTGRPRLFPLRGFSDRQQFEELQPLSEKLIPQMAGKALSGANFFNNHVRGQAPQNARMLIEQLDSRGYEIKV
jgi:uncharacterized protein YecE (DUF72 family)